MLTKLSEKNLAAVRKWPPKRQDEAAEMLLALDRLGADAYEPSAEDVTAIDEALAQGQRGEIASDEDVKAAFAR